MRVVRAQFVKRHGPGVWLWGLLVIGLAVAAGLRWQAREVAARHEMEQKASDLRARDTAEEAARKAQTPEPYAEDLEAIRKLRAVQWPGVLAALEVTPRGELQIGSLELDVTQQRMSLSVAAPSIRAILDYANELHAGVPEGEAAWRFSVNRVTERTTGGVAAELEGRWKR